MSRQRVVLVADDEELVRSVALVMLEHAGFRVFTASNGKEAVEIVRKQGNEIDVALLDLTMPVMNGEEALKQMLAIRPNLPVLLASGYNDQVGDELKGLGNVDFISKPFDARQLLQKLNSILELSSEKR